MSIPLRLTASDYFFGVFKLCFTMKSNSKQWLYCHLGNDCLSRAEFVPSFLWSSCYSTFSVQCLIIVCLLVPVPLVVVFDYSGKTYISWLPLWYLHTLFCNEKKNEINCCIAIWELTVLPEHLLFLRFILGNLEVYTYSFVVQCLLF